MMVHLLGAENDLHNSYLLGTPDSVVGQGQEHSVMQRMDEFLKLILA